MNSFDEEQGKLLRVLNILCQCDSQRDVIIQSVREVDHQLGQCQVPVLNCLTSDQIGLDYTGDNILYHTYNSSQNPPEIKQFIHSTLVISKKK